MLRVVTKRHEETRRFKDTGHRFKSTDQDIKAAFKFAETMLQTEYAVQVQSDSGYTKGWHELQTKYNTKNALLH